MLAVKGIYKDGQVSLLEPVTVTGPRLVAVTFLDQVSTWVPENHKRLEALDALEGIIGLLQDLTPEEQKRFEEAIERRDPFIGPREVAW